MIDSIKKLQASCLTCHIPEPVKDELCYLCATQQMIRGKWKLLILWSLRQERKRFSQIQSEIPNIKQGPLTAHLKELVKCGLIRRKSYNEVPPRVEYRLTEKGESFLKILYTMDAWARQHLFT